MTTELKRFTGAYATMTVATYEPVIVRWISGWTIYVAADVMAWRFQKAKYIDFDRKFATAHALNVEGVRRRLTTPDLRRGVEPPRTLLDASGRPVAPNLVKHVELAGFPDAVELGGTLYPYGTVAEVAETVAAPRTGAPLPRGARAARAAGEPVRAAAVAPTRIELVPTLLHGRMGVVDEDFDFRAARKQLFVKVTDAVKEALADRAANLDDAIFGALKTAAGGKAIFDFLPCKRLEEALSPIGVAHYYRQLYFNMEEGIGPIEEAFTIAPLETLEVVYETVRRQIHEELVEMGSETVSEQAVETKNLDEVSDKVSSMVQRDSQAAMSANASGSIGVWQASASASASLAVTSQKSREESTRRLKEVTRRASERITKSFSIKTRDVQDVTTTHKTHRVIRNESAAPVSYGLRRVLRKVLVKVQDLGPRLVWQLYIRNPGEGLARSRFVHFREAAPLAVPEVPPGVRPRPQGGTDTGTTSSVVRYDASRKWFVTVVVTAGADRRVTAVSIDAISDLDGGGKDDAAPSPLNAAQWGATWNVSTNTFTVNVAIQPGDSSSVQINYSYTWDPSQAVLDEWERERKAAVDKITQEALNEQFEREKALITERSKIRTRPPNDLRREERYEVMNRMISHLFARGDDPSEPSPLEIESFHRYFDIEGMFTYTHPSWWKPRYSPVATGFARPAYEITAESEPAPMGSSLGWMIQLDGDTRRNEFLNSPWVRVCLPIRPQREQEAIAWLAKHVEGEFGYDPNEEPLKTLLSDIAEIREKQGKLGVDGPEYVTVESTPGAPEDPLSPEAVYPIIDEFEVTVPTDGFVYDELKVTV